MNILLTGSEGFIGKHLHKHLEKNNHKVIPIDKLTGNDLLNCDLKYDVDLVIHLAGLSGVRDSLDRPTEYWKEKSVDEWIEFVKLTMTDYWLDCGNYSKLSREFDIPRWRITKFVKETIEKYNKI